MNEESDATKVVILGADYVDGENDSINIEFSHDGRSKDGETILEIELTDGTIKSTSIPDGEMVSNGTIPINGTLMPGKKYSGQIYGYHVKKNKVQGAYSASWPFSFEVSPVKSLYKTMYIPS